MNQDYELYTDKGNALAGSLIQPIIAEILEDALTRKQAVDKVTEAILKIRAVDDGMWDSEPLYNIWGRINKAFAKVGYVRYEP